MEIILKSLLKPILLATAIFFTSFANAQIGSAPLREGKTVQANFELSDTSMVWLAVDFENISHPSFQLNDLIINFETTSRNPLRDFYYFSPYKRDNQGKSYYVVGLSLPVGSYKITNISGKAGNILIGGNMSFNLEIPLRISNVGQHYYLGNISIQNVSTENNQLQRSGGRLPLIDQAISGYGNGTLNFILRDKIIDDVPIIKGLFPSVSTLQNSNFEKKLISFIKIPYALGQGLEPMAVRMQQLNQNESNASAITAAPVDINTAHSLPVPVGTNFAPSLELGYVPQPMNETAKRMYQLYVDTKRTKALAISGYGAIGYGFGAESMKLAIDSCEKFGKPCNLYAVDSTIVWNPEAPLAKLAKSEQEKTALMADKQVSSDDGSDSEVANNASTSNVALTNQVVKARIVPISSGYADVFDIAKIPYIAENCKKFYATWLTQPNPKAFSISPSAHCGYTWGTTVKDKTLPTDPSERSIIACNRVSNGANDCKHYAIDGVVVWKP
jgi:hypothetical protein